MFFKKKLGKKKREACGGFIVVVIITEAITFFFMVYFGRGFDALPNECLQVSLLMLVFSLSSGDAFQEKVADVTAARYLFV